MSCARVLIAGLLVLLSIARPVWADSNAKQEKWSVGAGLGFGSVYRGSFPYHYSLAGLAGTVSAPRASVPQGQFLLEYRLSEKLALTFNVMGAYSNSDEIGDITQSNWEAAGGLRVIFNPDAPVEVSFTAAIGTSVFFLRDSNVWYVAEGESSDLDSFAYALGAQAGLVFEIPLLDNLRLRLTGQLLTASYTHGEATLNHENGMEDQDSSNTFYAGLDFQPSMQLRLVF